MTSIDLYSKGQVDSLLNTKQNELVSGTNIRTVNGTSLLGSGNLTIGAGKWVKVAHDVTLANISSYTGGDTGKFIIIEFNSASPVTDCWYILAVVYSTTANIISSIGTTSGDTIIGGYLSNTASSAIVVNSVGTGISKIVLDQTTSIDVYELQLDDYI